MIRVGIFFGGTSREREISFAGGRTVYDNLDKNLFEAIPVFVDSRGNFIELRWEYIYKGTIRDFYPPVNYLTPSPHGFQVYIESLGEIGFEEQDDIISSVGIKITASDLKEKIDFAFLSLHGAGGEDGTIQGILEWHNIPYSGSGILPSAIGMNKVFQKKLMKKSGYGAARSLFIDRDSWMKQGSGDSHRKEIFKHAGKRIGFPIVIKPANQGSSIGASIITKKHFKDFQRAVDAAFFTYSVTAKQWNALNVQGKVDWVRSISEIKDGTGIPFIVEGNKINHPEELLSFLENHFSKNKSGSLRLNSIYEEQQVLLEQFIDGIEFSCIIIRDENNKPIALPPTEIKKGKEVFDYRSKYLAGMTRKVTPIDLPSKQIERIRRACEELFEFFGFHVYARIDGFIRKKDKKIFLNDPNTTSGMLPSSFFFHQAAEIGLNPSQFLTYIIRTSLQERIKSQSYTNNYRKLLHHLDELIHSLKTASGGKIKIGVILGGYSSERHISVESGRNIFEKLSSSIKYDPVPIFLIGNENSFELYQIPVNFLLKDNADDIRDKILKCSRHAVVEKIRKQARHLTGKYASASVIFEPQEISLRELSETVKGVFIALHGRPGEDGRLQSDLEKFNIPYNGSGVISSQLTINKFQTNELLKKNGFKVADHLLMKKEDWERDKEKFYHYITSRISFPLICKPVDDGCSAAVKKIHNLEQLDAFCNLIFRGKEELPKRFSSRIHIKEKEEFPRKIELLVEELITRNGAKHFLEITGGMLSKMNGTGEIKFEIFEPSEALATDEVLSLEEKFLAGQGQNITPARFADDPQEYSRIAAIVKQEFEGVARTLAVEGYCRIDAFVRIFETGKVETIIIEVNSLPGMTPATCIFHQAAIAHYKPFDFIDGILDFSFKRQQAIAED